MMRLAMSIVAPKERKYLCADALFRLVRSGFANIADDRYGDAEISLTDTLMSAFAMFSLKSPGCIGKKGAPYAAFFRGFTNVWGSSRSWAAADRGGVALPTGAKLGVWNVPVNTPSMTSSHRPALKAARRCMRR